MLPFNSKSILSPGYNVFCGILNPTCSRKKPKQKGYKAAFLSFIDNYKNNIIKDFISAENGHI